MSGSLLVEFHGWRGFKRDMDLFCVVFVAGLVSVAVSKTLFTDRLRELVTKIEGAKKRLGGSE